MISQELWEKINNCIREYEPCAKVFQELINLIKGPEIEEFPEFGQVLQEIDVNVIYPARKKSTLSIYKDYISIHSTWLRIQDIQYIFLFQTPNKTKPQWSLYLTSGSKELVKDTIGLALDLGSKEKVVNQLTSIAFIRKLGITSPQVELSKSKKQYVEAYLKNKDGFLYFLSSGVFFGFKKPLLFFGNQDIISMHVNCVTGRTFNLNINLKDNSSWEFSMIDQAEYEGISRFMEKFNIQGNQQEDVGAKNSNVSELGNLDNMEFGEDDDEDEDFRLSDKDSQLSSGSFGDSDSESGSSAGTDSDSRNSVEEDSDKEENSDSDKEENSVNEEDSDQEQLVQDLEKETVVEQENISENEQPRKKSRKSVPKKISGMQATADAVRKQLEKRIGKVTTLKRKESSSKISDLVYVESDVDELED